MKTLEQWQKELPDSEFTQSLDEVLAHGWGAWEVAEGIRWRPMQVQNSHWGANIDGSFIYGTTLLNLGAIFRRKKERQREFKIERNPGEESWEFCIDGKPRSVFDLLVKEDVKSATLTVNEWGGE